MPWTAKTWGAVIDSDERLCPSFGHDGFIL